MNNTYKMKIMKKILYVFVCVAAAILTACSSFLNQEPFDNFTDEEFWKDEAQTRTFMYGFYTSIFSGYGTGTAHGPFLMGQTLNDDFVSDVTQNNLQPEVVPVSDGAWSFTNIRRANYVLENIDRLDEPVATKNHWRGVARFFRACYYSNLTFTFGDVPYYDKVLVVSNNKEDKDLMYKDRDPRVFVDQKIIDDFQYALDSVRQADGDLQVNRFVVAGMASRFMLREGTFLKYHYGSDPEAIAMAEKCLKFAKDAALIVMNAGYSIAPSYNALFTSENLAGNPEVIMYRHYVDGVLAHSTLAYSYTDAQAGASKSLAEAFLSDDGFPVLVKEMFWQPKTAADFFANRDPRLALCIRPAYYIKGENCQPFAYALSGFSWNKFMDDTRAGENEPTFAREKNVTDAPCLRYAEVLLNYVEAAYELSRISSTYTFDQSDLDKSINLIRARADVNMPRLEMVGDKPAVAGVVYDDPKRLMIEDNANGETTPPLLWEIRRERRVELCFEGFRLNDLKRWGKLDYIWNGCNPDIRFGAYIRLADYPGKADDVMLEDNTLTEGYILRNTGAGRERPVERNYISPVPTGQIQLYEANGYKLTQTKEWQ